MADAIQGYRVQIKRLKPPLATSSTEELITITYVTNNQIDDGKLFFYKLDHGLVEVIDSTNHFIDIYGTMLDVVLIEKLENIYYLKYGTYCYEASSDEISKIIDPIKKVYNRNKL